MSKKFEFEVPSHYKSLACHLEEILSQMSCPITKEKTLMIQLGKVNIYSFGLYVGHHEPKYTNVFEAMALYFSRNFSKQELLSDKIKTKESLGNIIIKYNSCMDQDMRKDLQRTFNNA
ncbi:hypothetical protein AB4267_04670 [Vibrio cyclitrophicus]